MVSKTLAKWNDSSHTYVSSDRLKVTDLLLVQNELWDARTRWKDLGEALGMHPSSTDAIAIKHRDEPSSCFREMLTEWLRGGNDPPRTWSTIAAALRTKTVDLGAIAEEIESKYNITT